MSALRVPCFVVYLIGLILAPAARAELCVGTPTELRNALLGFAGATPGHETVIKVRQGTYNVGNLLGGGFSTGGDNVSLKLLGGYTAGCAARVVNPANTVLDGLNQAESGLLIVTGGDAVVLIEGFTFTRFVDDFAALNVGLDRGPGDEDSLFSVKYNRFLNNAGRTSVVHLAGAQMKFLNNLVAHNTVTLPVAGNAVVALQYEYQVNSLVIANNNTIAHNSGGPGLRVTSDDDNFASDRLSEISDNIIVINGGSDLDLGTFDPGNPVLVYANLANVIQAPFALDPSNITGSPMFISPPTNNYALQIGSPAINSGLQYQHYGIPAHDLNNGTRVIGSRIDRGAIESSVNDLTTAFVTVTGDNGNDAAPLAGSLRAAIKAGNAAGGPYTVRFDIPGACPRQLTLAGPMPDITGEVIIDGTSQAGWAPNTSSTGFNADLCLFLNGQSSATTPWAFHVPSGANGASLQVRGIVFTGFSDAAIRIDGGSGHRISGNQFGAVGFALPNKDAIRVSGTSGTAFIGGYDDTAAINLIAGTSDAGIYLDNLAGGSIVANNLIGFQTDGVTAGPNPLGIFVFNSPNNLLQYNTVGFSGNNGITISGASATGNQLQYNRIGLSPGGTAAGNGAAGVSVIFGGRNTTIGSPVTSTFGTNVIANNGGAGVWISPSGGTGNCVLGNNYVDNAGMPVDLAAAGPSPNQPSNPGSGPNNLQNFPILSAARRTLAADGGTIEVVGRLTSALSRTYRIDLFYDTQCNAALGERGRGIVRLGRTEVTTNSAGIADFIVSVQAPPDTLGSISAMATDALGNSSEMGSCVFEVLAPTSDEVFADGFE